MEFCNDFARNVAIFGVDNSSSSHADNRKNNFLVIAEGPTYGVTETFGLPEYTKFCLSLHYNADDSYLFVNGKEIFKFKTDNNYVNFYFL